VREALGRSRGGYGTKACVIADGRGRAIAFALAPGQAHELPLAPGLWAVCPMCPDGSSVTGASPAMLFASASGTWARVPPSRPDAPVACPQWIYPNRHLVENLWARLKEWRAGATRYEKTARSFLGVLCLAATADWLK
jgi:transposase